MHGFDRGAWEQQSLLALESGHSSVRGICLCVWNMCCLELAFQVMTLLLLFCLQRPSRVPRRAWTPFSALGGARVLVSSPSHKAAKAVSGAWASGQEGSIRGPQSHAFRPEAPPDPALQRPEQELLCHPHPPVGQQRYRVHAVCGEHGAGVPGGGGPEAGAAGGKGASVVGGCAGAQPQEPAAFSWHLPGFSASAWFRSILLFLAWPRS